MSLMRLESIHAYRVYDIPKQIRRKMDIGASATKLDDVAESISAIGNGVTDDAGFRTLLSDVATYDTTEDGFEVPIINVGADDDVSLFSDQSRIYNWVAVVTLNPLNETRSTEERCIITGYTSECEPSFGGYLPPETKLFINDILGQSVTYHVGPTGQRYTNDNSFRIVDNYVLANALPAQTSGLFGQPESYVLPDTMMTIANMQEQYQVDPEAGELVHNTAQFRHTPQCVATNMVSPDQFALNATAGFLHGLTALNESDPQYASWGSSVTTHSKMYFQQKRLSSNLGANPFVEKLRNHLSSQGFTAAGNNTVTSGAFTLNDLKMAIGNPNDLDNWVSNSVMESEANLGPMYGADDWSSNTMASLVSYDISTRLNPIMSKHGIGEITFSFSTMDYMNGELGKLVIVPESVRSLDRHGNVPRTMLQSFRDIVEYALINVVTKNHRIPLRAQVMSSIGGATRVELLVDGASCSEAFTYASCMSGRLNTTTSSDGRYVGLLAQKLTKFTKSIKEGFDSHLTTKAKSTVFADDAGETNLFGDNQDSMFGGGAPQEDLFGGGNKFKF